MIEYKLRPGGLMRCCTQTLADVMEVATEQPKEGDVLRCNYCKRDNMIFRDGAWEWNRPHDQ